MLHIIEHSVFDSLKLVPFLFLTYLIMEWLEHKASDKTESMIRKAGKWGPVPGGILGVVPQCGFSAAASNLYAGRLITIGTLLAIYLSTSDEMLPILISAKVEAGVIGRILLVKVLIAIVAGFLIDLIFGRKRTVEHGHIHEMCEHEHCHCEEGILRSAAMHTLKITAFVLLITMALNTVLHFAGEDVLISLLRDRKILGPILSGLVGLIPNCAASVAITQLYVEGAMSFGTMMAGLLAGSGVGILVLCRVNHNKKENFKIISLLYAIGVMAGILLG